MTRKKLSSWLLLIAPIIVGTFSLSSCKSNDESERNIRSYKLCEQLNTFIADIKNDGTLIEIQDIWFGNDESKKIVDRDLSGENGTITFATSLQSQPMGYYKEQMPAGFSTDIIYRFAKKYGYSLEIFDSENTNSSIAAVLSGKADFGGTYCSITEERKNNGCFSDPYFDNKVMVMVSNETAASITSLDDLNGAPWGCCEGSTYHKYLSDTMTRSNIYEYATETDALTELSSGRIKGVVLDRAVADYVAANSFFPNLCEYSQFYDYADQYAFFFPKFVDQSLKAYETKKIATVIGSVDEQFILDKLPNAEIYYYETLVDCCAALSANKVDAYADETASFIYNKNNNPSNLYRIPENLGNCQYGFLFPRDGNGEANCTSFNAFLSTLRYSGKLKELCDKWIYHYEDAVPEIDYKSLEGEETFRVATIGEYPPFSFVRGGELVGLEVEIAAMFAKAKHMKLDIEFMSLASVLTGIEKATYDFAFTVLTYTPDRAAKFHFSDSYFDYNIFLVVNVGNTKVSLWEKIANSFESTFVKEQRWKLLFTGLLKTIEITLLSIVFGSILGLGIFLIINKSKNAKKIFKVLDYIVNGMPVVVLLMIFYYIIFAKTSLSGTAVAVGVFTILFTSSVARSLSVSVDGVNQNQIESALALGYKRSQALFRFVIPQALPNFLKLFKGDILTLLKGTAIVGYIAVQDLTKATDIIRSRTYEAIFPLLTLALIYFLIAFLLGLLVRSIQVGSNPKRRKPDKILKGVKKDEHRN